MTSITLPARGESYPQLRALNILRDLPEVADLVELCFSNTMDNEGRGYVKQMRDAGHDSSFLHWADQMIESTSLPLSGYVWEENGKIVGNASLVPFRHRSQKIYLIANVATHPDYRRRGIARAVTEKAMELARKKKAGGVWLHVRDDNPSAINIYTSLGFVERARRSSWQGETDPLLSTPETDLIIGKRHPRFWNQQLEWLKRLHPEELAWHRNWNWNSLQPGLRGFLYRLFVEYDVRQWAASRGSDLQAALAWIPTYGKSDALWAAAKPNGNETALQILLMTARKSLSYRRVLALDYPAGHAVEAIRSAGFTLKRTLIWMHAPGATSSTELRNNIVKENQ